MARKLGVIGGLGPVATAYFYELLCRMTDARLDQEHIDMVIISKSSIPDRTDFILGRSTDSPLPHLIEAGKVLELMEVDYIAIPCITAHYFHEEISGILKVPIIHIIKETVRYLKEHGITKAGIMATEGTIKSGLFQKELVQNGIMPIIPTNIGQEFISNIIYKNIKAGLPVNMDQFNEVKTDMIKRGADTIILGCTELSLIKRDENIGSGFIDSLEVLASCSIKNCNGLVKKEYRNLIR